MGRLVNAERKISDPKPENAGNLLIFCGGSTEYNYLWYFKSYLQYNLKVRYSNIILEPINAAGNAMHVYNYAEEFLKDDSNRKKYDLYEKHLVFDCDAPDNIEEVLRLMSLSENAKALEAYWAELGKTIPDHIKEMNPSVSVYVLIERLLDEIEYSCK